MKREPTISKARKFRLPPGTIVIECDGCGHLIDNMTPALQATYGDIYSGETNLCYRCRELCEGANTKRGK